MTLSREIYVTFNPVNISFLSSPAVVFSAYDRANLIQQARFAWLRFRNQFRFRGLFHFPQSNKATKTDTSL